MQNQGSEFRFRLEQTLESCGLPMHLAAQIEERLILVTYEKGAIIFLRGAPSDVLFCLLRGFAKLYLPREDGSRILVDLARPGDFLGFVNDRDSKGRHQLFEAHALTKCQLGLFTRDQIATILGNLKGNGSIELLDQINCAWSNVFERYVSFIGLPFRMRLEVVLTGLGNRFGISEKRGTLLVPELSHEDLAEMIGSSRPMVSKLIADLIQEGLIARGERRHFIIRQKQRIADGQSGERRSSSNGSRDSIASRVIYRDKSRSRMTTF